MSIILSHCEWNFHSPQTQAWIIFFQWLMLLYLDDAMASRRNLITHIHLDCPGCGFLSLGTRVPFLGVPPEWQLSRKGLRRWRSLTIRRDNMQPKSRPLGCPLFPSTWRLPSRRRWTGGQNPLWCPGQGLSKLETQGKVKLNPSYVPEPSLWAGSEPRYVMGSLVTFCHPTICTNGFNNPLWRAGVNRWLVSPRSRHPLFWWCSWKDCRWLASSRN